MANHKIRVTYADGTVKISEMTPRVRVMIEEKFGAVDEDHMRRGVYFSAWAGLHKSGQEPADFDTWLDKVSEVEDIIPKLMPCMVCGAVGGCSFDKDPEDEKVVRPLFHMPPTVEEDEEPDPTRTAQSTDVLSA